MNWIKNKKVQPQIVSSQTSGSRYDSLKYNFNEEPADRQLKNVWGNIKFVIYDQNSHKIDCLYSKFTSPSKSNISNVSELVQNITQIFTSASADYNDLDPIVLDLLYTEKILDTLYMYTIECYGKSENVDQLLESQLDLYEFLTISSNQKLLYHKQIIEPLLQFVTLCSIRIESNANNSERLGLKFIFILHQLCIGITVHSEILNLLFNNSLNENELDRFPVFNLLIPYVHREGYIGQQARDALLLIMSLSGKYEQIGFFIANQSNFCPVLATGLSGLYSSLPCKLEYPSDDWHHISDEDLSYMPELKMFINSLEFCNAVIQVSHPSICTRLLEFVVNGFLLPVVGPALNQNFNSTDPSSVDSFILVDLNRNYNGLIVSTIEEVIAATAYLDLFMRKITEPSLLKVFVDFLLKGKVDDVSIMDLLITRISSQLTRLCVVTLTLFQSLIDLNCEDVMFHLVFKYLMPCKHIMLSQHRVINQIDYHCNNANKFLSLMPLCFNYNVATTTTTSATTTTSTTTTLLSAPSPAMDNASLNSFEDAFSTGSINNDNNDEINNSLEAGGNHNLYSNVNNNSSTNEPLLSKSSKFARLNFKNRKSYSGMFHSSPMSKNTSRLSLDNSPRTPKSSQSTTTTTTTTNTTQQLTVTPINSSSTTTTTTTPTTTSDDFSSYDHYLKYAHFMVLNCKEACNKWLLKYDGCQMFNNVHSTNKEEDDYDERVDETKNYDDKSTKTSSPPPPPSSTTTTTTSSSSYSKYYHICGDITVDTNNDDENESDIDGKHSTLESNVSIDNGGNSSRDHQHQHPYEDDLNNFILKLNNIELESERKHPDAVFKDMDDLFEKYNLNKLEIKNQSDANITTSRDCTQKAVNLTHLSKICTSLPDKPLIGPFLESLMERVDRMMQSTLYVNLHLTSIVSRLACYPHPLLTSFLLNQNLVFQPSVKSLFQALNNVKLRLDDYISKLKDRDLLLAQAQQYLICRINQEPLPNFNNCMNDAGKKKSFDIFKSNSTNNATSKRLLFLPSNNSARFDNKRINNQDEIKVSIEKRNALYAAVVFKEFIKELAAIAQEQTIIQLSTSSSTSSSSSSFLTSSSISPSPLS